VESLGGVGGQTGEAVEGRYQLGTFIIGALPHYGAGLVVDRRAVEVIGAIWELLGALVASALRAQEVILAQ
jgi:hypothetical protein